VSTGIAKWLRRPLVWGVGVGASIATFLLLTGYAGDCGDAGMVAPIAAVVPSAAIIASIFARRFSVKAKERVSQIHRHALAIIRTSGTPRPDVEAFISEIMALRRAITVEHQILYVSCVVAPAAGLIALDGRMPDALRAFCFVSAWAILAASFALALGNIKIEDSLEIFVDETLPDPDAKPTSDPALAAPAGTSTLTDGTTRAVGPPAPPSP
jgi:hypothetical protein